MSAAARDFPCAIVTDRIVPAAVEPLVPVEPQREPQTVGPCRRPGYEAARRLHFSLGIGRVCGLLWPRRGDVIPTKRVPDDVDTELIEHGEPLFE